MNCGLLGRKLSHSYSPQIHSLLGEYRYDLVEKEPEELEALFASGIYSGMNVTIPYKKAVLSYCDHLTPEAKAVGAVNTVVRQKDGSYLGHNTDIFGFRTMLEDSGLDVAGKKVLVLGSGGASNTAVHVLTCAGANVIVISRSGENNYQNLSRHADAALLVNATPVGMYPNAGISPVDLDLFPHLKGVLDLIYNPARTKLLLDGEKRGLVAVNGLKMLVAQAKESAEYFTHSVIDNREIHRIYKLLKTQMENIILIGMPGSAKSTVGKLLAEKTGKPFFDADLCLAETAGKTIPEIFAQDGEDAFRALETQTLKKLGMCSGAIIATGGGCVTRDANYPLLHQNGTVFWLERALNALPTDGRPLSQQQNLFQMYEKRQPQYHRFADYRVDNNGSPEAAAAEILKIFEV